MSTIEGQVEGGPIRVEVQADSTGTWASNGVRFDDPELARKYAIDLFGRWTAVRRWRVIDGDGYVLEES